MDRSRRSARVQHKHSMTLTPAVSTTDIDTTTPALAKLGKMVIEHLQSSGGAISQIQNSGGAVQSSTDHKPKRNRRNKNKTTPPDPKRYGTRLRKSMECLDK